VGVLRLRNGGRDSRFHNDGPHIGCGWRERVPSFKQRRSTKTNQYQSAHQAPHENDWFPRNENLHGLYLRGEEHL